jgi:hypothetical protein
MNVVPFQSATASPRVCIVCNGTKEWQGRECWCCVLRLPAPPAPAPIEEDFVAYPDLQAWTEAAGGYDKIDWGRWDLAVKRAKACKPTILNPETCAFCGFPDSESDPLLPLGIFDVNARVALHASCWGPWLKQRE